MKIEFIDEFILENMDFIFESFIFVLTNFLSFGIFFGEKNPINCLKMILLLIFHYKTVI